MDASKANQRNDDFRAFSLIELMVVITIIVVLLALLTPALDRAIYQAELVNCAGRLHAMAAGTLAYTMDHQRRYPHRTGAQSPDKNWLPNYVCTRDYNERPVLLSYMPAKMMLDPFAGGIDIETNQDGPVIYVNYLMWFGFIYTPQDRSSTERAMKKMGDAWTWTDPTDPASPQRRYRVLASDEDTLRPTGVFTTHPDRERRMSLHVVQDFPGGAVFWIGQGNWLTFSWWQMDDNTNRRSDIDMNFAYDDGSVVRVADVKNMRANGSIGDERMHRVAESKFTNADDKLGWGRQVPAQ